MYQLKDILLNPRIKASKNSPDTPFIADENTTLSMHFNIVSVQSTMRKHDPDYLVLGYTRTMMGFLFFNSAPASIVMIGLGGGSLAKYCAKHLPDADFTAVEINAQVIALRDKFKIPTDSDKFRVLHANGADYVLKQSDKVDVLLIDGFDEYGHPTRLCSAGFYDDCYAKLRDGGVMVVNLLNSDLKYGTYVSRIRNSFEDQVVVVDAEGAGNKVVFAYKGIDFPISKETLLETIRTLGPQHPIPLHNTAHKIMQRLKRNTSHSEWEAIFQA